MFVDCTLHLFLGFHLVTVEGEDNRWHFLTQEQQIKPPGKKEKWKSYKLRRPQKHNFDTKHTGKCLIHDRFPLMPWFLTSLISQARFLRIHMARKRICHTSFSLIFSLSNLKYCSHPKLVCTTDTWGHSNCYSCFCLVLHQLLVVTGINISLWLLAVYCAAISCGWKKFIPDHALEWAIPFNKGTHYGWQSYLPTLN